MGDTFVPHSHVPYGADGSGFYTDNTIGCFHVIEAAKPRVLQAIDAVPAEVLGSRAFTICDMGTADGGMSMFIMRDCIDRVREKHGKDREVNILYEDQPINDFKSLFLRIHGLISGPPSYMKSHKGVYFCAIGTGFFDQCSPCNSVDLIVSFTAMHWLSQRPCMLSDALHHTMAANAEEKAKFAQQAATDWETVLMHRAKELVSGGQMVIACFCVDKEGQYLGNTKQTKQSMYARMTALWRQLVEQGRITEEEFRATTFNNYYRTVEEYKAPLDDVTSAVYKAGLRLVDIETKVVPCPYRAKWLAEGKTGDSEAMRAHARWYVPTTRTWSNSTFYSGLSDSRSEKEREAIVDDFFALYEDEVAKDPADHGMDYVHAYISIRKQQ